MATHYRTQAFILKKTDRGESNQLLAVFSKDFGKLNILGKAIRKIKSKLRQNAETFYLSDIEFIQGKACKTLTDAITIEKFGSVRQDLERLKIAYEIAEVVDDLVGVQEKDGRIWELINEVFQNLNQPQLPIVDCKLLYYYFFWNLLSLLGYQVNLYECAVCQNKLLPEKLYFNPEEGGIICSGCFKKMREEPSFAPAPAESGTTADKSAGKKASSFAPWASADKSEGKKISPEVIKIIRIFLKKDLQTPHNNKLYTGQTLSKLKIDSLYQESLESVSKTHRAFIKKHYLS